jgi:FtsH-binding integral membrane protein
MSYQDPKAMPFPVSQSRVDEVFPTVMRRVYLWMFLGLLVTAGVAGVIASRPGWLLLLYQMPLLMMVIVIAQFALVIALAAAINRLSLGTALLLFFLYAALNGLMFASIFLLYSLGSVALAFIASASLFAAMSIIGYTTKVDLTQWGGILFMALIGLIIASVVNIFLASTALDWIITYAGILIFLGLTVYDTQRIKKQTAMLLSQGDEVAMGRIGVLGALRLYLDFINLFLMILRLTGRRS